MATAFLHTPHGYLMTIERWERNTLEIAIILKANDFGVFLFCFKLNVESILFCTDREQMNNADFIGFWGLKSL